MCDQYRPQHLPFSSLKILACMYLGNPISLAWVRLFRELGAEVTLFDPRDYELTPQRRDDWAIPDNLVVYTATGRETLRAQLAKLAVEMPNPPDLGFTWWGSELLPVTKGLRENFPTTPVIHCVDTLPDARSILGEVKEVCQYLYYNSYIAGYIHYSNFMLNRFLRVIPTSKNKRHVALVEPFHAGYCQSSRYELIRTSTEPYLIFTGRGNRLWSTEGHSRKDALGPFLKELASMGVRVYVESRADIHSIPNMHHYPHFSNKEVIDGTMNQYIAQFDVQLVAYNEFNSTIRRRVASGLSTRFAHAITTKTPMAISANSTFVAELGALSDGVFWFDNSESLYSQLVHEGSIESHRSSHIAGSAALTAQSRTDVLVEFISAVLEHCYTNGD